MNPNDKVQIYQKGELVEGTKTHAEITFHTLTPEILRDIARNESNSWDWRKAAVKFLLEKKHKYAGLEYLTELVSEINEELEAEHAVQDIVETAIEAPMLSEKDKKILELEAEIERLKNLTPKFESNFKDIPSEEIPNFLGVGDAATNRPVCS